MEVYIAPRWCSVWKRSKLVHVGESPALVFHGSWRKITTMLFCELALFRAARVIDSDRA